MRGNLMRVLLLPAALLALAVAIGACGSSNSSSSSSSSGGGKSGGTLTVLNQGDFEHADPGAAYYQFDFMIDYATQRPLYSYKPAETTKTAGPRRGRPGHLAGQEDGHGEDQEGRQVQPAREPRR